MSRKSHVILQFCAQPDGEVEVEVVPLNWIDQSKKLCFWPPCFGGRLKSLIKKGEAKPLQNWTSHSYDKILEQFASFEAAAEKLPLAVETSNLESEEETRKRSTKPPKNVIEQVPAVRKQVTRNRRLSSSSSESGSSLASAQVPNTSFSEPIGLVQSNEISASTGLGADEPSPVTEDGNLVLTYSNDIQDLKSALLDFQRKVFKILETQAEEIKEIKACVFSLRAGPNSQPLPDFSSIPALPLSTETNLSELEDWLSLNSNRDLLVDYLSLVGGKNIEKNTRNILRRLFSAELSRKVNFTGKGGKIALRSLKILDIIKGSVRRQKPTADDDTIEKTSTDWFRNSKDREGGREKRRGRVGSANPPCIAPAAHQGLVGGMSQEG